MVATRRRFNPNLQKVRVLLNGVAQRAYVCTRCLKAGKIQKAILSPQLPRGRERLSHGVEREHLTAQSELGRITIASDVIAQIVGHTAAECYGVVGMAGKGLKRLLTRDRLTQGIEVGRRGDALLSISTSSSSTGSTSRRWRRRCARGSPTRSSA